MWIPYDERYAVSVDGDVMNTETGKVLPINYNNSKGYGRVYVNKRHFPVHRLVGLCFLPRIDQECLQIDHIDGDKTNNTAYNLRWCDNSQNQRFRERRHISYYCGLFWVKYTNRGIHVYRKSFKTLEEATTARDAFKNSEEYRVNYLA